MSGTHNNIRVAASAYASRFLANKYKAEYRELYRAYLINRGIPVRDSYTMVDERKLTKE
jgi:hypothetical protein